MSGYRHPDLVALDDIEDLLEAYADAHLSASGPVLARIRRAALAAAADAQAQRLERMPAQRLERMPSRAHLPRFSLPWLPRLRVPGLAAATAVAATMGLGMGAVVLAAPAGSPFYGARVALEQAFLPAQVDDRLAAHEELLLARLAEAEAAAASGDAAALAAALAAYDAEVEKAFGELGSNVDLLAHLEEMLAKHVVTLTALEASVPDQGSIDKALANSQKAIVKIKEKTRGRPDNPPGGPDENRAPQN